MKKIELTNYEFINEIIKRNQNYEKYLSNDYIKFINQYRNNVKKMRSSKMFELDQNQIEFIKKYDITNLEPNEFLSNKITIQNKNPYQIKYLIQILDYYFTGKIQPYIQNVEINKNNLIYEFEEPLKIKTILEKYFNYNIQIGKYNNRILKYWNILKKEYIKYSDIPISKPNRYQYSSILRLLFEVRIKKITENDLIWISIVENYILKYKNRKDLKTKFKRTNNFNYDNKKSFYHKNNIKYNKNCKHHFNRFEPKWGYINTFFPTSHTNRERKKRYYMENQILI